MKNTYTNIQLDANGWHSINEIHKVSREKSIEKYFEILQVLKKISQQNSNKGMTMEIKAELSILGHKKNYRVYTNRLEGEYLNRVNNELNKGKQENEKFEFVNTEWMFDLIWYRDVQDKKDGIQPATSDKEFLLQCLSLAVESEWGGVKQKKNHNISKSKDIYGEVKYDFQKLAIVNAERRLMICKRKRGDKSLKKLRDYIEEQIQLVKMQGDVMCVVYDYDFSSFWFQLFRTKKI